MQRTLGTHTLIDFHKCSRLPNDPNRLCEALEHAARLIGATVVQSVFHKFTPYGLSGVVVIAESHMAIHTWPEHNAACVDFFTCNSRMNPLPGIEFLCNEFKAASYATTQIARGNAHHTNKGGA